MKTNTNTTTTTTKTAIMSRAWEIRRAAAAEIGCSVSAVLMSGCLSMAWAETQAANAPLNAAKVAGAWDAMTDDDRMTMLKRCIHKAAKDVIGYSVEDKYLQFTELPAFGLYGMHDLDEFISETYIRIADRCADLDKLTARNVKRAEQGKKPLTLVKIVYDAAKASIQAVYYQDAKHSAASVREMIDDDGDACSVVENACAGVENTERSATLKADMERFKAGRDAIDNRILELVQAGYTEREIAAEIGTISNVAVHKRIVKMREALKKEFSL